MRIHPSPTPLTVDMYLTLRLGLPGCRPLIVEIVNLRLFHETWEGARRLDCLTYKNSSSVTNTIKKFPPGRPITEHKNKEHFILGIQNIFIPLTTSVLDSLTVWTILVDYDVPISSPPKREV